MQYETIRLYNPTQADITEKNKQGFAFKQALIVIYDGANEIVYMERQTEKPMQDDGIIRGDQRYTVSDYPTSHGAEYRE